MLNNNIEGSNKLYQIRKAYINLYYKIDKTEKPIQQKELLSKKQRKELKISQKQNFL